MIKTAQHQEPPAGEYVVECFWPGVSIADVDELDRRARSVALRMTRRGTPVDYLGSILVPADEVVLFEFNAGSVQLVAQTCLRVGIPFQRIVLALRGPREVKP